MITHFVGKAFYFVAEKYFNVIMSGRPGAVMLGFILAVATGAAMLVESIEAAGYTTFFGVLAGPFIAALLCPRPPLQRSSFAPGDGEGLGAIVDSLETEIGAVSHTTIVMERAIYLIVRSREEGLTIPTSVYLKLAHGIHPQIEGGNLIVFANILYLEAPKKPSHGVHALAIHYRNSKGKLRSREVWFHSAAARADYAQRLEGHMRAKFERKTAPVEARRVLLGPMIALVATCLATIGLIAVSADWTNNPPAPRRGKTEQDPLVQAAIQIGPMGMLLLGAGFMIATLAWIHWRMKNRSRVTVFRPVRDA
jgi:hypothetical protein